MVNIFILRYGIWILYIKYNKRHINKSSIKLLKVINIIITNEFNYYMAHY